MSTETVTALAARLLTERGPMGVTSLVRLSGAETETVRSALAADPHFVELEGERWASLPALLEGVVLAHRVTSNEADTGSLPLEPDLAPLAPLVSHGLPLATGGILRRGAGRDWQQAQGSDGWLEGTSEGTLIGLRLRGGALEVGLLPAEEDEASRQAGEQLAEALHTRLDVVGALMQRPALHLGRALTEIVAESPGLLRRPVRPLGVLLEAAGLVTRNGLVERADHGDKRAGTITTEPAETFDQTGPATPDSAQAAERTPPPEPDQQPALDETGDEALALAIGAIALFGRDGEPPDADLARSLVYVFGYPGVADALAPEAAADPALERFLDAVAAVAVGPPAAPPLFLMALCADARGDRDAAERHIGRALRAAPGYRPALLRGARHAGERREAGEALRLLDLAGITTGTRAAGTHRPDSGPTDQRRTHETGGKGSAASRDRTGGSPDRATHTSPPADGEEHATIRERETGGRDRDRPGRRLTPRTAQERMARRGPWPGTPPVT